MTNPRTPWSAIPHQAFPLRSVTAAVILVFALLIGLPRASALEWTNELLDGPSPHWVMEVTSACAANIFNYDAASLGQEQHRVWQSCDRTTLSDDHLVSRGGKTAVERRLVRPSNKYLKCLYAPSDDGYKTAPPFGDARCAGHWGVNRMIGLQPWHFEFAAWVDKKKGYGYVYAGIPLFQEIKGKLYLATPPVTASYWTDSAWADCSGPVQGITGSASCSWTNTPQMLPKYTGIN